MIDAKKINEIVESMISALPDGFKNAPEEMKENIKLALNAQLVKLDVVTREEFDVQMKVLRKTRAKLDELEQKIKDIEKK